MADAAVDRQLGGDEPDLHRNAPRPDPACLYGLVGEIARTASETTEANPYAVALNLLIYISVGVGRGPYMPVGNTWHHCNLFGIQGGRSGRGRKGDAASIVHRIDKALRAADEAVAPQVHRGGLSSREGLALLIHDAYTEGKNEVPAIEDKRLAVFESEFVNVLHQGRRDGNTLSAALRDAFDGVSIRPATKTSRVWATDPHIGIMGAITPTELRGCMASRELTNGFANRFIMIWAERLRMLPFPQTTPQQDVDAFAARIASVFRFAGADRWVDKDTMRIGLSAEASKAYGRLYRRELNSEAGGPSIAPLLERRAPVLLRLAMIFALTDQLDTVDTRHIEAAFAWIRYWQDSVLYIFSDANDEAEAQEVSELAGKITDFLATRDQATRKELTRDCFQGHTTKERIDAALDELLGSTPPRITVESVPRTREQGPGSPTKVYRLAANPANSAHSEDRRGFAGDSRLREQCEVSEPSPAEALTRVRAVRTVRTEQNGPQTRMNPGGSLNSHSSRAGSDATPVWEEI
jgi:hypothetical protein